MAIQLCVLSFHIFQENLFYSIPDCSSTSPLQLPNLTHSSLIPSRNKFRREVHCLLPTKSTNTPNSSPIFFLSSCFNKGCVDDFCNVSHHFFLVKDFAYLFLCLPHYFFPSVLEHHSHEYIKMFCISHLRNNKIFSWALCSLLQMPHSSALVFSNTP